MPWWMIPAAIGAIGASAASTALKGKTETKNEWLQNPEYPEAEQARTMWLDRLKQWGEDPNYGAVTPDWGNIWEMVQRQIKQYYEGGPLQPGVKDRLKSSLARRNMSDSPAYDYMNMAADAEMGNRLTDASTNMGIEKANLAESGRKTWLQSLEDLQGRKPQGQWNTTVTDPNANTTKWLDFASNTLSSLAGAGMQSQGADQQNSWLQKYLNGQGGSPQAVTSPYQFAQNQPYQRLQYPR